MGAILAALSLVLVAASPASAQPTVGPNTGPAVPPVDNPCPRFAQGAEIGTPPALYSQNGVLAVLFSYQQTTDAQGRTLYCYMTPDGLQNPTLNVLPGDTLYVTLTNNTPQGVNPMQLDPPNCGALFMNSTSVNLHYHGTNTSPTCGSDEVIKTTINSGDTFTYGLTFPTDEPPGLYWYHPHVHGISDPAVMGGATGALVVDGIESVFPVLQGMPQQMIVLRDQRQYQNVGEASGTCWIGVPFRDVTVNNVPVNSYALSQQVAIFVPASLTVPANQTQFWRVANTSADTILDLALNYDGVQQPLSIYAIDGVPVNSQDGTGPAGPPVAVSHFRLPPASRVEFTAQMPGAGVRSASFMTSNINTGADGDCNPMRRLISLSTTNSAPTATTAAHRAIDPAAGRRFAGLGETAASAQRLLYFAENADQTEFYMAVDGQAPHVFNPNQAPGIVTQQGAVEQWVVQNRSLENHEFHIHQIHFLVQSQNDFGSAPQAPGINNQYLDMIEVPAWSGNPSDPYPSVTLLMDFRGAVVGDFVFHCHLLNHEDLGMMNIIQVVADQSEMEVRRPATPAAHQHGGSMRPH